ncbi:diaminopimelate decarboxylase [Sinorhizobium meliloti]|uniref:diaminopimelate decarboxylase n=1 Tax=Rhizobium meliloti TaxID=382 RepID=UPI000FDA04BA|nr:diaminopimelate decarboxylase [Sinorhizobium meliloti]MDW9924840.1 diaminopimelate decarboxylase [Sinorhizobium meliloti]MDX0036142.1 diaminopimelate decarboxylase [Sinorhizobium meliloti]RVK27930.1 diaminopimelate decarboxylase [Sinorhizobium meliloti]
MISEPARKVHTAGSSAGKLAQIGYGGGSLMIEGVHLETIAAEVATPFYCYSADAIRMAFRDLSEALTPTGVSICFAVKANGNLSILRLLAELGSGMDIVSSGELERALAAGAAASKVIFSGVGKSKMEIAQALRAGIRQFNVESEAELDAIISVAKGLGKRAPVALRINPDVDAKTHAKISTGKRDDKFGIAFTDAPALYARAALAPEVDLVGLAVHIGSQILDLAPYRAAFLRVADLVESLRNANLPVRRLDLGGGLGIQYHQGPGFDVRGYAKVILESVGYLGCELTVEPGRWLVGPAGLLITQVLYVKQTGDHLTAIVDAGMNDLMRPALYDAMHPVLPLRAEGPAQAKLYQVAGPVCESSDVFGTYQGLPELKPGSQLAFGCAGAYGASMSSTYNARDLVAEVLVDQDRFALIRRRQTTQDLLALEIDTKWRAASEDRTFQPSRAV